MKRAIMFAALALGLAACSSGRDSVFERVTPILREQVLGADEAPAPPPPGRAALDRIPYATIAIGIEGAPRAFVVPVADNGGYLVYQDPSRRSVVMRGGLITATHGLGHDLGSVTHGRDDPVVAARPVADWPGTLTRVYGFSPRGREAYRVAVVCTLGRGAPERIEIVERGFELVRVTETCRSPRRSFVNTYWADAATGFIWKSEQWIGPRQPPMTIEIVRPYAAG